MKKVLLAVTMCVIVASMSGCATTTVVGGAAGSHGLFSSLGAGNQISGGATEIASYTTWLGLIDTGFDSYVDAVKKADADGKLAGSVTKWFWLFTSTTAYAR